MSPEQYCHFDPRSFEELVSRLNPPLCSIEDPLEVGTNVVFAFSPDLCLRVYAEGLAMDRNVQDGDRRLVQFSPVITKTFGWRRQIYYNPFFFNRERTGETFESWGMMEKVEIEKVKFVQAETGFPPYAAGSLPGILEEMLTSGSDLIEEVSITPDGREPVSYSEIKMVKVEEFAIRIIPLGVLWNEERSESPIVPVTAVLVNDLLGSRERVAAGMSFNCPNSSSLASVLWWISRYEKLDAWGRVVAGAWFEHSQAVNEPRFVTSLGRKEFFNLAYHYHKRFGEIRWEDVFHWKRQGVVMEESSWTSKQWQQHEQDLSS